MDILGIKNINKNMVYLIIIFFFYGAINYYGGYHEGRDKGTMDTFVIMNDLCDFARRPITELGKPQSEESCPSLNYVKFIGITGNLTIWLNGTQRFEVQPTYTANYWSEMGYLGNYTQVTDYFYYVEWKRREGVT